jgi:SAM-dependent methyltransferase
MVVNETEPKAYKEIKRCRLCRKASLVSVLDLGMSALTGVFPRPDQHVPSAPLELVWCADCTLLQLRHAHDPLDMYGENYGYRSGLNRSMVRHLRAKAERLSVLADLEPGDTVLDIGCNDGTLLGGYTTEGIERLGIDPTVDKFREFHPEGITAVADFFSQRAYESIAGAPARVITSVAMFYDLDDPLTFTREVASALAPDGIWHFEQSYMPAMLRAGSYDTVCHEHLEYYSLRNISQLLDAADLEPISVRFNSVNGGSFSVTAAHRGGPHKPEHELINWLQEQERRMGLDTPAPFREFEQRVFRHRADLVGLLDALADSGSRVYGYGASTKGNVMLQFAGITQRHLKAIAEVNPDKFGRTTPGSNIPIISESEAKADRPDYLVVLPWHFREGIIERESDFLRGGGRLIFPLPEIEIVGD